MTFKERCDKIKKTATQFWNENKTAIIGIGGFIAGTFITYKILKSDIEYPAPSYTPVYIPTEKTADPEPEPEVNDNWDEDSMRENWDWVCELASNMEMGPDEEYHIYSTDFDVGGIRIGDNIVSHIVCGEEVYPDDVEEYEELYDPDNDVEEDDKEEPEDDEDEYIEIQVNKDDPAVKDIARKFVALINTNAVSVRRKEND